VFSNDIPSSLFHYQSRLKHPFDFGFFFAYIVIDQY
jgi:hypothetical protein